MATMTSEARWERLQPTNGHGYQPISGAQLRLYSLYGGMLTTAAWEQLGKPEAVAIELSPSAGYSIIRATLGEPDAVPLSKHRRLASGMLSPALRGETFPLVITLLPAPGDPGRLIFGAMASEPSGRRPRPRSPMTPD